MDENVLHEILNKVNETSDSVKGIEASIGTIGNAQNELIETVNKISANQEQMANDIHEIAGMTKDLNERVFELEEKGKPSDPSFGIK